MSNSKGRKRKSLKTLGTPHLHLNWLNGAIRRLSCHKHKACKELALLLSVTQDADLAYKWWCIPHNDAESARIALRDYFQEDSDG